MKRACILLVPALLLMALATGCEEDDHSVPKFTRLTVTPACGVAPMDVEGYAVLSGGNESGDPMGANNGLEIKWDWGKDQGTGSTTRDFHTYHTPGDYEVNVSVFYPAWAAWRSQTLNFTVAPGS